MAPGKSTPPSNDSHWAEAISQAAEHVEAAESGTSKDADRDPRGRRLSRVLLGLLVAFWAGMITLRVNEAPPATLPAADQSADLRREAAALIEEIHAHWEERGVLPLPQALVPFLDEGYDYQVVDSNRGLFVVRRSAGGITVTYDGSLPLNLWILLGGQGSGGGSG